MRRESLACALIVGLAVVSSRGQAQSACELDFTHGVREIERACGALIQQKRIDWKAVEHELLPAARAAQSDAEHFLVLVRLLARLRDGHAEVRPSKATEDVRLPSDGQPERTGCGMFWCTSGKKVLVKSAWNAAAAVGVERGWEVLTVGGAPVQEWLAAREAELRDVISFSTDHQARFFTMHQGLSEPAGSTIEFEFKDEKGAKKKRSITFTRANQIPSGPAIFPEGLAGDDDVRYGVLESGFGYVHLRRCRENLPARMDEALAVVGKAKGVVLDFRANGGGSFDHEAFMGRFVPAGQTFSGGVRYASAGPHPYGGRIVVIVDSFVRSAGETGAGIFKEDGRAYMIGEGPTAGMSSQKTEIALPSGRFSLYVSTGTNKGRFNGGRGIEGIGVVPHELVAYDQRDLGEGVDTLIRRAEELLERFPESKVPFKAAK
jgi:C-terminal processing protease CtpA/Prc